MLSAKFLTTLFGATFIFAGLIGFVPNPLVAPDGIFAINAAHNIVHILTGVAFLIGSALGFARMTLLGIGVAYVVVTIVGFLTTGDYLLGFIHINLADRWLHAGLALAILVAGFISHDTGQTSKRAAS